MRFGNKRDERRTPSEGEETTIIHFIENSEENEENTGRKGANDCVVNLIETRGGVLARGSDSCFQLTSRKRVIHPKVGVIIQLIHRLHLFKRLGRKTKARGRAQLVHDRVLQLDLGSVIKGRVSSS